MRKIIFIILSLFLISACSSIQELTTTQISSVAEKFIQDIAEENTEEGTDITTKITDIKKVNTHWEVDYQINISNSLNYVLLERTLKLNNKGQIIDDISKSKTKE
ncbi:hypothetical protein CEE44_05270 [Candidatus Woesearchaeota archaeon B3_Woes]|nr:MAG: hypothetical protein CEE44_05270 [Candidatus Woesearchaeota archaeon B3_Woes]